MRSNQLFYHEKKKEVQPIAETSREIPKLDWKTGYQMEEGKKAYRLEDSADDSTLNRMIQLRSFNNMDIIEGKPGLMYWDKEAGKVKVFVDAATGWKNLAFEP